MISNYAFCPICLRNMGKKTKWKLGTIHVCKKCYDRYQRGKNNKK